MPIYICKCISSINFISIYFVQYNHAKYIFQEYAHICRCISSINFQDNQAKHIFSGICPFVYAGALKGVLAAASRNMVAFGTALELTHWHTEMSVHCECALHITDSECILYSFIYLHFWHFAQTHHRGGEGGQCTVHFILECIAYNIPIYIFAVLALC